ncbi:MAG: TonB family protein [Fibrobacter sp.]|nr:TonB family protein [Fibrobacter sp.]
MSKKVFVSYSRADKDVVFPIVKRLQENVGDFFWIDLNGIESGDQFVDVIISAIERSEIVLFMHSENSLKSGWTKKEIMYASNHKKKIVPVDIEGKGLSGWYEFQFGGTDYIDAKKTEQLEKLSKNLMSWLGVESTKKKEPEKTTKREEVSKIEDLKPVEKESPKVICSNCGSENSADQKFCGKCGSLIELLVESKPALKSTLASKFVLEPQPNFEAKPIFEEKTESADARSVSKKKFLIIGGLLILALVAFTMNQCSSDDYVSKDHVSLAVKPEPAIQSSFSTSPSVDTYSAPVSESEMYADPAEDAKELVAKTTATKKTSSESVPADRSADQIMSVVRRRTPGLRHIYNKFLKERPGFQGRVTLKFQVAPEGNVSSISIVNSTTGYDEFDEEISNAVGKWRFGKVQSGSTTITIPFSFFE